MDNQMQYTYQIAKMDFASAGEASSAIKKTLKRLGVPPAITRRVAIATYEAEINVAIHSNGGKIDCIISPEAIKIIATDNGPGIADVEKAMQKGYSTASKEARELGFGAGMGLPNMAKCSDHFNIESELGAYTKIEMTIDLEEVE